MSCEQQRLDWILADEPLRTYGKRGQYNTDINMGKGRQEEIEGDFLENTKLTLVSNNEKTETTYELDEEEAAEKIPGKLTDFLTTEQKLRIKQFYKIRKDTAGNKGFFLVKFNSKGIYESGHGPYNTAGEAYEKILELEGVEIPE